MTAKCVHNGCPTPTPTHPPLSFPAHIGVTDSMDNFYVLSTVRYYYCRYCGFITWRSCGFGVVGAVRPCSHVDLSV